ncbi:hypothetical protein MEO43_18355 [Dolichospermum sp. ST_sed5]|nr:hypothetical protein [Dolichospermum sp. ST_sed5]
MSVNSDGIFFGILTNQEYDIEHEKVETVRKHISKFDEFLPSQKMIDRLQKALDLGQKNNSLLPNLITQSQYQHQ